MAKRFKYPRLSMKLELVNWDGFKGAFNVKEFEAALDTQMRMENRKLAQIGAAVLTKSIRDGKFTENSALQILLKKSSKPLIDHGDLIGSVSGSVTSDPKIFDVGVKRVTPNTGRNLAHMLETGWTQKVTPAMRAWFRAKAREFGGDVRPLKSSTTHIKVPPRSYMRNAFFDDKSFQKLVAESHKKATHRTFLHLKTKYGL